MNKLYVVGIGPGSREEMTVRAEKILEECELIVGYGVYAELLRPEFPDKEYYVTPMRGEAERCRYALSAAREGRKTAVVCSGDSGIYGMAGLLYELRGENPDPEIEVAGGLTAACSGAAVLGAPLTHDFAVVSLSDLLTDMDDIIRRVENAAAADFSIVLYNPSSVKRSGYLRRACDAALKSASPNRACGVVKNIGREGQESKILTLGELRDYKADMFTTVFIGNSKTKVIAGKLVTPRGYRNV